VVEIERRANRWQTLLEDGARAFQEAGSSIARRWRALLRTGPQIRLLLARLRGRFRYGQHRAYARWSALRFAPLALALVLGGFAWRGYEHWQETEVAHSKANQILVALGELRDKSLSQVQINALWELATAEDATRDQFLTELLASEQRATRFLHRPGPVVRALVGLDPDRRERTRNQLALYLSDKKVPISKAAARTAIELDAPDVLDASRLPELFDADEIAPVAPKLTGKQAARAVEPVLAAIKENTNNPDALRALAQGLAALAAKLTGQSALLARRAAERMVAWNGDPKVVETYTGVLTGLADQLGKDGFTSLAADVLKYPMSAGKPTGMLADKLRAMHPGAPDFDEDVWRAVSYAEEERWPVDLRAAP
jgi:hypothetical protein